MKNAKTAYEYHKKGSAAFNPVLRASKRKYVSDVN